MGAQDALSIVNGVLVMVAGGLRDQEIAERGYAAFRSYFDRGETNRILMDVRLASSVEQPEALMRRASEFGAATPPCKVAILARWQDGEFARIYRRALSDTGHDVQVFTSVAEAEAWLSTEDEADRLYLV